MYQPPNQQPLWQPQPQQPFQQPQQGYPPPVPPYFQPPPMMSPPPRKPRRWKAWQIMLLVMGILAVLSIIGTIVSLQSSTTTTSTDSTPTTLSTPTTHTTATPTPTPVLSSAPGIEHDALQLAQNSRASGTKMSSHYDKGSGGVVITETIREQIDNNKTIITIQNDCFQIQRAIWKSSLPVKAVDVHIISNSLVDQYGNTSSGPIGICTLNAGTAQKFHWDKLSYDQAWNDYDYTWYSSALNQ